MLLEDQPAEELNEGEDFRENASRRPPVSLAIPAFTASLSSITDTLHYNCDCAYTISRLGSSLQSKNV